MNFKMKDKNKAPFKVEDVNWDELSGIGILKDELEQAGAFKSSTFWKKRRRRRGCIASATAKNPL